MEKKLVRLIMFVLFFVVFVPLRHCKRAFEDLPCFKLHDYYTFCKSVIYFANEHKEATCSISIPQCYTRLRKESVFHSTHTMHRPTVLTPPTG